MVRKYVKDYRLDNVLRPDGRLKTVAVYEGDWYEYAAPEAQLRRSKKSAAGLAVCCLLSLFCLLWFSPVMGNAWYVILAPCLSAAPLAFLCASVFRILTVRTPMTRAGRDYGVGRLAPASLITAIFAGLGAAGCAARLLLAGAGFPQIAYTAACALYFAAALLLFLMRGAFRMQAAAPAQDGESTGISQQTL